MLRKINKDIFFYLCQSANWQCVVEAQDEECAATAAIEKVMKNCDDEQEDGRFSLSMVIAVKKMPSNLIDEKDNIESTVFYSPTILANAGFHSEASNLHNFLCSQEESENNEQE